ncbi:MAG: S8 family serine peptidase [Cyclobacteriaceae bacterium]
MRILFQIILLFPLNLCFAQKNDGPKVGFGIEQIKAEAIIEAGLTGKGVKIGIIDVGFYKANSAPTLKHLFEEGRVKAYRDFVTPNMKPYVGSRQLGDDHGTEVWKMIAGFHPEREVQFGLARNADFYLARTDDSRKEYRVEEEYLIAALEWLDSLDVKLVNISIGYSTGFDDSKDDYKPEVMDGKSLALTRAAQTAAEKGMLLVIAGGNDGNNAFQVVSTPGDAKDALTVGATGFKTAQKVKYSSVGGEFLTYLKPDIACFSASGTSFSAPLITGLAACIWEMNPDLTNLEVKELILKSANLHPYGNNYIGFGVPNAEKILTTLKLEPPSANLRLVEAGRKKHKLALEESDVFKKALIFHKKDSRNVIDQVMLDSIPQQLLIERVEGAAFTTILLENGGYEIKWK